MSMIAPRTATYYAIRNRAMRSRKGEHCWLTQIIWDGDIGDTNYVEIKSCTFKSGILGDRNLEDIKVFNERQAHAFALLLGESCEVWQVETKTILTRCSSCA